MCNGRPRAASVIAASLTEAPQQFGKFFAHQGNLAPAITTPDPNDEIVFVEIPAMLPVPSAQHALTIIPRHGGPAYALTYADTKTSGFSAARRQIKLKVTTTNRYAPREHAIKPTALRFFLTWIFGSGQTAKRTRPRARRALIMARPPRVFMRTRKP